MFEQHKRKIISLKTFDKRIDLSSTLNNVVDLVFFCNVMKSIVAIHYAIGDYLADRGGDQGGAYNNGSEITVNIQWCFFCLSQNIELDPQDGDFKKRLVANLDKFRNMQPLNNLFEQ